MRRWRGLSLAETERETENSEFADFSVGDMFVLGKKPLGEIQLALAQLFVQAFELGDAGRGEFTA